ncbi:MAG: endonuclease Q family protein [Candidatus Pacearchaeota archaeon]|nr:endonuclease Q family protein [Candidatus Pacearchaeota archaeon]
MDNNIINFDDVIFADLHIHSRFSRACSSNLTFENLVKWAKIKGLNLLGTGDFTHPIWLNEIKAKLIEKDGFYYYNDFPFIISGEISLMYSQEGPVGTNFTSEIRRGRRIHLLMLVPNIEIADKINAYLDTKGRRDYDGRPIFKISGEEFVREMMKISKDIEIIPAHCWTPWFGIFGSASGFDSLKECFKEQIENVHAIETGMSSDPEMNWRIKELENKSIVSFSDAHSFWPFRLGREATIFKKTDFYKEIIEQIRNNTFVATIETDPAYGKYHWDGHRACKFSCEPNKTKELKEICPVCKKQLTIGVENRIERLAYYPKGFRAKNEKPFYRLLPLQEVIALAVGSGLESKSVWQVYNLLIENFENEFNILLNVSREEFLKKNVDIKLADLIIKNREEKIKIKPGYDGEYGKAVIGIGERQAIL